MKKLFLVFAATGSLALALTNNCAGGSDLGSGGGCGIVNTAFTNLTVASKVSGGGDAVAPAGNYPGISPSTTYLGIAPANGGLDLTPTSTSSATQALMTNLLTPGTNFGMDLGGTSAVVTNAFGTGGFGTSSFESFDSPVDAPEPGTIGLVGLSLAALGLVGSRLRRKA